MNARLLQRRTSYAMQVTMLIASLVAAWHQQWVFAVISAGALAITLVPLLMDRLFGVRTPAPFLLFCVSFVFGSLFLGEAYGLYRYFWWWDLVLHLLSGFLLGVVGFLLVYVLNGVPETGDRMRHGFVAFFAFLFAVAMGAFWEVFEFCIDVFFSFDMQKEKTSTGTGLVDSMSDLIVDTVGALFIALIGYFSLHRQDKPTFLMRWIDAFIRQNPQLCGVRPGALQTE